MIMKECFPFSRAFQREIPFFFLAINTPQTPRHVWVLREIEGNKKTCGKLSPKSLSPRCKTYLGGTAEEEQQRFGLEKFGTEERWLRCPEFQDALGKKPNSWGYPSQSGRGERFGGVFPGGSSRECGISAVQKTLPCWFVLSSWWERAGGSLWCFCLSLTLLFLCLLLAGISL